MFDMNMLCPPSLSCFIYIQTYYLLKNHFMQSKKKNSRVIRNQAAVLHFCMFLCRKQYFIFCSQVPGESTSWLSIGSRLLQGPLSSCTHSNPSHYANH
ncbi:hypothetical protein EXN66_Car010190 [Channa argus]|uniref:Uncharacterized protein n=1 Tax=Channa argus TaxID=215402 RepID=A0A6G1PWJ9_CHAAH|nr:hypothetical protein EXN66_Car010190 [Channa argus]